MAEPHFEKLPDAIEIALTVPQALWDAGLGPDIFTEKQ